MRSDDDDKNPRSLALVTNDGAAEAAAPPVVLVAPPPVARPAVMTRPFTTPMPAVAPRPTLSLKKAPFGRPAGALTIAEMIERITKDVGRATAADVERRHAALRGELVAEVKTATSLGLAAILMNAVALVTIIVELAFARVLPARGSALALAALTVVFAAAFRLVARRPPTASAGSAR